MHILFTILRRFKELLCWIFNLIFGLKRQNLRRFHQKQSHIFLKLDDLLCTYDLKLQVLHLTHGIYYWLHPKECLIKQYHGPRNLTSSILCYFLARWLFIFFFACLAIFGIWPFSSECSLSYHIYCDTWHPFKMVISEDP